MFWNKKIKKTIQLKSIRTNEQHSGTRTTYNYHSINQNMKYIKACIERVNKNSKHPVTFTFIEIREEKAIIEFTGKKDQVEKIIDNIMFNSCRFLEMYEVKEI